MFIRGLIDKGQFEKYLERLSKKDPDLAQEVTQSRAVHNKWRDSRSSLIG